MSHALRTLSDELKRVQINLTQLTASPYYKKQEGRLRPVLESQKQDLQQSITILSQ